LTIFVIYYIIRVLIEESKIINMRSETDNI
jgi:hypothetical protein